MSGISVDILVPALKFPSNLSRDQIVNGTSISLGIPEDQLEFLTLDQNLCCLIKNSKFSLNFIETLYQENQILQYRFDKSTEALNTLQETLLLATQQLQEQQNLIQQLNQSVTLYSVNEKQLLDEIENWKNKYEEELYKRKKNEKLINKLKTNISNNNNSHCNSNLDLLVSPLPSPNTHTNNNSNNSNSGNSSKVPPLPFSNYFVNITSPTQQHQIPISTSSSSSSSSSSSISNTPLSTPNKSPNSVSLSNMSPYLEKEIERNNQREKEFLKERELIKHPNEVSPRYYHQNNLSNYTYSPTSHSYYQPQHYNKPITPTSYSSSHSSTSNKSSPISSPSSSCITNNQFRFSNSLPNFKKSLFNSENVNNNINNFNSGHNSTFEPYSSNCLQCNCSSFKPTQRMDWICSCGHFGIKHK